jgi:tetratricopeptide (TPR) repeat protein
VPISRVVQFPSKLRPFEEALASFAFARNADCLAALRDEKGFDAGVLRARAHLRLRRFASAEKSLRAVTPLAGDPSQCGTYYTLLATILDRQNHQARARDAFVNARSYALGYPSRALHSELAYYEAHGAMLRRELPTVERIVTESLSVEQPLVGRDEPHSYPLEVSRAFLWELLGLINGHAGRFDRQIANIQKGLMELNGLGYRDVWTEASLLCNLAAILRDVYRPDVAKELYARAKSLPWSNETHLQAYEVHRALGWHAALCGDVRKAMQHQVDADGYAPSTPYRMESLLDRSYLLRELGESVAGYKDLDEAFRIAQSIDWKNAGEERLALLWLAENMAYHGMLTAVVIVDKYKAIDTPIDRRYLSATDKRYRGRELDALGMVAAVTGQTIRGLTMLHDALAIWESLGFEWRAAKTARIIARITQTNTDIADARRRAASWPNSWLAKAA